MLASTLVFTAKHKRFTGPKNFFSWYALDRNLMPGNKFRIGEKMILELGTTCPADESIIPVSSKYNYLEYQRKQACLYIKQLWVEAKNRNQAADQLITLRVKSNQHDFGSYLEIIVKYDCDNEKSGRLAYFLEGESSTTWLPEFVDEALSITQAYNKANGLCEGQSFAA